MSRGKLEGTIYLVLFVTTVWLANWLILHVGVQLDPNGPHLIPVGFGIMAPAGVLAAGVGFTLRDLVQRRLGPSWSSIAILCGAGLSALLSPMLALASGGAFLASEMLDLFVYTPLRRKNLYVAVVASNIVGMVVDSIAFLFLAYGLSAMSFLPGQIIGKAYMTLLALPIVKMIEVWDRKRNLSDQSLSTRMI